MAAAAAALGSPNTGGTGYVRKRSGVGGQRLRFSVGAAANGSLTIAEENEEDTCRLDAEDTCYTHAEEEAGVSGRGTAELIFAATHEGGSKVLGVIAPPPGSHPRLAYSRSSPSLRRDRKTSR